jgi:hypothetical protein
MRVSQLRKWGIRNGVWDGADRVSGGDGGGRQNFAIHLPVVFDPPGIIRRAFRAWIGHKRTNVGLCFIVRVPRYPLIIV